MPKRKASSESTTPSKKSKNVKSTGTTKQSKTKGQPKKVTTNKTSSGKLKKGTKKATTDKTSSAKLKKGTKKATTDKKSTEKLPNGTKKAPSDFSLITYLQDAGWLSALKPEFEMEYFKQLEVLLQKDYNTGVQVFPPEDLIFNAFNKTPMNQVKVVILGQDPYHDDGQAMGMSFSVPDGVALPPSLKNIYKELVNDTAIKNFNDIPTSGSLVKWADRGVLLINATLTVEAHKPNSHAKYGWQKFTDNVIKTISDKCTGVVFVLWGNFAHKKEKLVDASKHAVIKTAHPSPLSFSKWLGCKCFSNVNKELKKFKKSEIDWTV